jgi:hypothetical protein
MKTSTVHPNKSTSGGNHAMTAPPISLARTEEAKKSAEATLKFNFGVTYQRKPFLHHMRWF